MSPVLPQCQPLSLVLQILFCGNHIFGPRKYLSLQCSPLLFFAYLIAYLSCIDDQIAWISFFENFYCWSDGKYVCSIRLFQNDHSQKLRQNLSSAIPQHPSHSCKSWFSYSCSINIKSQPKWTWRFSICPHLCGLQTHLFHRKLVTFILYSVKN